MLDGLNSLLNKSSDLFIGWWDKGYYAYAAAGVIALIFLITVFFLFAKFMYHPPTPEDENINQFIIQNAMEYCKEKGFTGWYGISKTQFNCTNRTGENKSIDKFYSPS